MKKKSLSKSYVLNFDSRSNTNSFSLIFLLTTPIFFLDNTHLVFQRLFASLFIRISIRGGPTRQLRQRLESLYNSSQILQFCPCSRSYSSVHSSYTRQCQLVKNVKTSEVKTKEVKKSENELKKVKKCKNGKKRDNKNKSTKNVFQSAKTIKLTVAT